MEIRLEPDVQRVLEFMVQNIAADKLVAVARGVNEIAAPLWARYGDATLHAVELHAVMHESPSQLAANE